MATTVRLDQEASTKDFIETEAERRKCKILEWIEATDQEVARIAQEKGWMVVLRDFARSTLSRYLKLTKDGERVVVRISDHKSIYKTERFSLSPDGYDHCIQDVLDFLDSFDSRDRIIP